MRPQPRLEGAGAPQREIRSSAARPTPRAAVGDRFGMTVPFRAGGYAGRVIEETLLEAIEKMEKAVGHVQSQFQTVRTGRAAPALVERINVDYYGAPVPLQQLASIQVPEARQLLVRPHDRASLGPAPGATP